MTRSQKRIAISLLTLFFVLSGTILISLLARGYRPDFQEKELKPTGLLVVNSFPKGAQVFINGKLTTATNQTINLPPGEYRVTIKKPGFSSWEKNITLEKEIVTNIDAYLFPLAPDLKALTFSPTPNPFLLRWHQANLLFLPKKRNPKIKMPPKQPRSSPKKEEAFGLLT